MKSAVFRKKQLMFPPWVLTLEWKLFVSFTTFKPKSVVFWPENHSFWAKSTIFPASKLQILVKTVGFSFIKTTNFDENRGFWCAWGLGLPSSKVFQTKDQQEHYWATFTVNETFHPDSGSVFFWKKSTFTTFDLCHSGIYPSIWYNIELWFSGRNVGKTSSLCCHSSFSKMNLPN